MQEDFANHTVLLQVDNTNTVYLNEAAKWAKFLAIVGFAVCGMLVFTGLFAGTIMRSSFNQSESELSSVENISGAFLAFWFIVVAILYFLPSFYLFKFASSIQRAFINNDQATLNAAFRNLKSCLKFWGIFFAIILSLYALVIIFAIIGNIALH
jgi:hypothetical protein